MNILVVIILILGQLVSTQGNSQVEPVITLERTTCFGTCSSYKLSIFSDGRVVFEGKEFVKQKGVAIGKISKNELQELVDQFKAIKYFNLKNDYVGQGSDCPEWWTDSPGAQTSLNLDGRKKAINHYHGCRGAKVLDDLTFLEDKIDKVVNTRQWIE